MKKIIYIATLFVASIASAQVGIGTTTPLSALDINGNLSVKEIGIVNANVSGSAILYGGGSGNATAINDGVCISLTPSGSNNDFYLPNPVDYPGRIYIVRNISDTNYAYMYTAGSPTAKIFPKDSLTAVSLPLALPHNISGKTMIFISDGKNWTYFN